MSATLGGFTLPGEAGHDAFTLAMAHKWGADVIRDSDGTSLSDEILNSGQGGLFDAVPRPRGQRLGEEQPSKASAELPHERASHRARR